MGSSTNFTYLSDAANTCKKDGKCAGFQCFQYCKTENSARPWECENWDPDSQPFECSFILAPNPCRPGYNNIPSRRSMLFIRHDFGYSREFVAPEFYHRARRTTTVQPPRRVRDETLDEDELELLQLRRLRKAVRMRRMHRSAMGDYSRDRTYRERLLRLRSIISQKKQAISGRRNRQSGHDRLFKSLIRGI